MYTDYFHFTEPPFSIAPDPHFLYMSNRHQEGLAHLLYGINSGGFIALTGEVGTGKTTLCHCLLQQLPDDVDIALILNPKLNSIELLANICDELGISFKKNQVGLKEFTDLLNQYLLNAHANGRRTVLMIDEAQNLSMDVLEQIRLLTNLETPKTKLLQIVLVGQPELKQLLNQKDLRQLNQRITARYHLQPLSLQESRIYINHRLSISGGDTGIFKDNAIRRIFKISQGIPRLINVLCDRSLLGAYSIGVRQVTPAIVNNAAKEALDIEKQPFTKIHIIFFILILMVLALLIITFVGSSEISRPNPTQQTTIETIPVIPTTVPSDSLLQPTVVPKTEPEITEEVVKSVTQQATDPIIYDFTTFIQDSELSLPNALIQAFQNWDVSFSEQQPIDCQSALKLGFRCLFDQGTLKDILRLNRPAILEINEPGQQQKHYALLVGINHGYPVFRDQSDKLFRLEDMLNHWQGYYLILWKPPISGGMQGIYPQKNSPNVLWLREILHQIDGLGTPDQSASTFFDSQLEKRVRTFQRNQQITADGIAGTKTILRLENAASTAQFPKLEHID